jgi:hypothetical protein
MSGQMSRKVFLDSTLSGDRVLVEDAAMSAGRPTTV